MLRLIALATAAGTALTNTVTETSLARKQFVPNELSAGKIFDFEAIVRVTAQNSTDTLSIGVRFGTSATPASNTACAAATAVDAVVGHVSTVRGRIHVQSPTRAVMSINMPDSNAEGQNVEAYTEILTLVPGTTYNLDITGTWSVANAGNSVQAETFSVSEIS